MSGVEHGGIGVPVEGIYILDLETEMLRPLPEVDSRPSNPAWTPKPDVLSFDRGGISGAEIATLDLASDSLEVVVSGSLPHWSPDGNYLAFVRAVDASSAASGQPAVFTLNLKSRQQRLVYEVPEAEEELITGLSWSPDSNRLALSATWWTRDLGYTGGLFIASADGRDVYKIADDAWFPGWMPGGTWLYFLIGDGQLGFAPVDFECVLTPLEITDLREPAISPSGDQMAFAHNDNIYLLDLDRILGTNREKLTCAN